jgi:hypothetical protein
MSVERVLRWSLVSVAILGLAAVIVARLLGRSSLADLCWTLATVPVVAGLAVSIGRDLLAGRLGVDAIALLSMTAALVLGEPLAGAVIALMYSGGTVLEVIAVSRAERNLRLLVDRAPRRAHRRADHGIEDVPIADIAVGDRLLVRAGEVIPVDGIIDSDSATIDQAALTGEPIPVVKSRGALRTQVEFETGMLPPALSQPSEDLRWANHWVIMFRSARIVVTMGMPALLYRSYFGAYGLRGFERSMLSFAGIKPIRESLYGLTFSDQQKRARWIEDMRRYGRRGS